MNELLKLVTEIVGDKVPVGAVLRLAPVLAPVVVDLVDGDAHLSAENRARVLAVLMDVKEEFGL